MSLILSLTEWGPSPSLPPFMTIHVGSRDGSDPLAVTASGAKCSRQTELDSIEKIATEAITQRASKKVERNRDKRRESQPQPGSHEI